LGDGRRYQLAVRGAGLTGEPEYTSAVCGGPRSFQGIDWFRGARVPAVGARIEAPRASRDRAGKAADPAAEVETFNLDQLLRKSCRGSDGLSHSIFLFQEFHSADSSEAPDRPPPEESGPKPRSTR